MDYSQYFSVEHVVMAIIVGFVFSVSAYIVMVRFYRSVDDEEFKKELTKPKRLAKYIIVIFAIGFFMGIVIPIFFDTLQYVMKDISLME